MTNNSIFNKTTTSEHLSSIEIRIDDVIMSLKELKTTYYIPPDGIPSIVLKKCCWYLAYPLYTLFSLGL